MNCVFRALRSVILRMRPDWIPACDSFMADAVFTGPAIRYALFIFDISRNKSVDAYPVISYNETELPCFGFCEDKNEMHDR